MNTNKMKLSEAIRAAVDSDLAACLDGYADSNKYLHLDSILYEMLPHEKLHEIDRLACAEHNQDQRQAIRFMYAEFLALEQEDIEALGEQT